MSRILLFVVVIGAGLGGWFWWERHTSPMIEPEARVVEEAKGEPATELTPVEPEKSTEAAPVNDPAPSKRDPYQMPFIVQAPNGEWDNPLFENGCEEASILMVAKLFDGVTSVSPDEAKQELLAIAAYEKKTFGHAFDTSATDTAKILKGYFSLDSQVVELESEQALQQLVEIGHVVVIPTDGRKLGNPFFKAPGPETHMLVILAYDAKTKEYIVNDPGTKRGAKYRYKEQVLFDAIADYVSGAKHTERKSVEKTVIVVSLEKQKATP